MPIRCATAQATPTATIAAHSIAAHAQSGRRGGPSSMPGEIGLIASAPDPCTCAAILEAAVKCYVLAIVDTSPLARHLSSNSMVHVEGHRSVLRTNRFERDLAPQLRVHPARVERNQWHEENSDPEHDLQRAPTRYRIPGSEAAVRNRRRRHDERKHRKTCGQDHPD